MSSGDKAITAVVAFAAEDGYISRLAGGAAEPIVARVGYVGACGLHELKAGDTVAFDGQTIDLAHLFGGENFHGVSGLDRLTKVKGAGFGKRTLH
jgi:hypothetical protein